MLAPDYLHLATTPTVVNGDDFTGWQTHRNPDDTIDRQPTPTLADLAALSDMDAERDWQAVVDAFAREVYGEKAL